MGRLPFYFSPVAKLTAPYAAPLTACAAAWPYDPFAFDKDSAICRIISNRRRFGQKRTGAYATRLDAHVLTGPCRGQVHFARYLIWGFGDTYKCWNGSHIVYNGNLGRIVSMKLRLNSEDSTIPSGNPYPHIAWQTRLMDSKYPTSCLHLELPSKFLQWLFATPG